MKLINIPEELKTREKSPIGLTGILVGLLRAEFPNLHIDVSERWDPEQPENYPAIFVKRGEWTPVRAVINDSYQYLLKDDGMGYTFWLPINATFNIIGVSNDKGEAETILNDLFLFLLCSSKIIRQEFGFKAFNVLNLSPTDIYQKGKDTIIGRVDIQIIFDFPWKISKVAPNFERIFLDEKT